MPDHDEGIDSAAPFDRGPVVDLPGHDRDGVVALGGLYLNCWRNDAWGRHFIWFRDAAE